ncbi:MAG: hypothetical protein ACOC6E_02505 [Thermodesulfobacteriota bacterium]
MKINVYRYLAILVAMAIVLVSGCSWIKGYGKIRLASERTNGVTIQQLEENWDDYHIFYGGLSSGNPSGIMFDPKHDERKLTGDGWTRVDDRESASEIIGWLRVYSQFPPELHVIIGPESKLYGYLFYPVGYDYPVAKVIDEKTLYVYDLESPVYMGGPDFEPRQR